MKISKIDTTVVTLEDMDRQFIVEMDIRGGIPVELRLWDGVFAKGIPNLTLDLTDNNMVRAIAASLQIKRYLDDERKPV